jgi:hypothetical protein
MDISTLINDERFIEFYCQKEDKWLQNAELAEKVSAIFGNLENAVNEFESYKVDNSL